MRLKSHLNRGQRGRKQRTEGREAENREQNRAALLELFVYFLCHIVCLAPQWQASRGRAG